MTDKRDDSALTVRATWVLDETVSACEKCKKMFGSFTRKHHCRGCGHVFCDACTTQRAMLDHIGYIGEQRVCQKCFRKLRPPPVSRSPSLNNLFEPASSSSSSSSSDPINEEPRNLENIMTLQDRLGRPLASCRFRLNQTHFHWNAVAAERTRDHRLRIADLLAVEEISDVEFMLYGFPWKDFKTKKERVARHIRVKCGDQQERDEWIRELNTRLRPSRANYDEETKRKVIVLVNPFGGQGKALNIWKSVEYMFRLVPVQLVVQKTQYAGHAQDFAREKVSLEECDALLTVSGDGLMHEVIQGLMQRPDAAEAIRRISLGVIPAGSGNGLAASLGALDPLAAAFNAAKGISRPLDLIKVTQSGVEDRYCFLSVNWGLVSDVDFESERWRFMGGARFTVGALVRIANLRFYKAKLRYLPAEQTKSFCIHNTQRTKSCPECIHQDFMPGRKPSLAHIQEHATETDLDFDRHLESPRAASFADESEWKELDTEFVTIAGCNISHLGYDFHLAPFAHFSDGAIDLCILKKCARGQLASMFTTVDTGEFVNSPAFNMPDFFQYIKVKAFRIEPTNPKAPGIFGYDGERGKSVDPILCESMHGLATIYG